MEAFMASIEKRVQEVIGGRTVRYNTYEDENGTALYEREYIAKCHLEKDDNGSELLFFDVELPAASLKNIPFAGEFDNYRELDMYCDWLGRHDSSKKFVAHVATSAKNQYTLIAPDKIDGKHMYYILVE